jgi:hypothetical protein
MKGSRASPHAKMHVCLLALQQREPHIAWNAHLAFFNF